MKKLYVVTHENDSEGLAVWIVANNKKEIREIVREEGFFDECWEDGHWKKWYNIEKKNIDVKDYPIGIIDDIDGLLMCVYWRLEGHCTMCRSWGYFYDDDIVERKIVCEKCRNLDNQQKWQTMK